MRGPQRYSRVPWLSQDDLEPMGDPETTVELWGGQDITHGLRIVRPFGPDTDATLSIHASKDSGEITLAISAIMALDYQPVRQWQPYIGGTRAARTQADGHADEGD